MNIYIILNELQVESYLISMASYRIYFWNVIYRSLYSKVEDIINICVIPSANHVITMMSNGPIFDSITNVGGTPGVLSILLMWEVTQGIYLLDD